MPSRSGLRVLAVALVAFAASSSLPGLAAISAGVGLVLYASTLRSTLPLLSGDEHRLASVAALAVTAGSLVSSLSKVPPSIAPVRPLLLGLAVAVCSVTFVAGKRLIGKLLSVVLGMLVVLVTMGALVAAEWNSDLGTDIYHAHRAAGRALIEGENPYTDAVRFVDGSPYAEEDRVIEGYPYPPIVLFTFGLAGAFTDPRVISAVAWTGLVAWFGWRGSRLDHASEVALAVFVILATLPIWGLLWYAAWTEPLSLALFAASTILWRRRASLSGVLLGLALASKQYFVFLAPLLALHRDDAWARRATIASCTILATILPALTIDPEAFVSATLGNLASIVDRPDSQSIPGLLGGFGIEFALPVWAWLSIGLAAGILVGSFSRSAPMFAGRSGLILGVVFITGLAFANYWVLVCGLLALGTVHDAHDGSVFDRIKRPRSWTAMAVPSDST